MSIQYLQTRDSKGRFSKKVPYLVVGKFKFRLGF